MICPREGCSGLPLRCRQTSYVHRRFQLLLSLFGLQEPPFATWVSTPPRIRHAFQYVPRLPGYIATLLWQLSISATLLQVAATEANAKASRYGSQSS